MKVNNESNQFEEYFQHLKSITFLGRSYKRLFSSPILFLCARYFGTRIVEVGSGTGSGVVGTFPSKVVGLDINPLAVEFSKNAGLSVSLIADDGSFPVANGAFDACILDNVLEHIEHPHKTLSECCRVTGRNGGLIIAVPGVCGYESDSDHKRFYGEEQLRMLDARWSLVTLFSIPMFIRSLTLSQSIRQYCLVAVYKKRDQ